jgi:hypothetical protein
MCGCNTRHTSLTGSGPCSRPRQLGRSWPSLASRVKVSPSALRLGLISLKEMTTGMTKRWMAEITYRNGDAPTVVQFEELAELHDR